MKNLLLSTAILLSLSFAAHAEAAAQKAPSAIKVMPASDDMNKKANMKKIKQEFKAKKRELKNKHKEEMQKIKQEFKAKKQELKNKHKEEMQKIKQEFEAKKQESQNKHQ